jgi:hypothetical protein
MAKGHLRRHKWGGYAYKGYLIHHEKVHNRNHSWESPPSVPRYVMKWVVLWDTTGSGWVPLPVAGMQFDSLDDALAAIDARIRKGTDQY